MEKYLKKLMSPLLLICVIVSCGFVTSCSYDDDSKHPLTGYWISYDDREPFAYQFNKNGSGTAQYLPNGRLDKFSNYMVADEHLLILWEDDDEYDDLGAITIEGKTFVLDLYGDELMTFTKQ